MSVSGMSAAWVSWLVETSIAASLLIVTVAVLLRGTRNLISPRSRHALWLVVVLRLVLPAPIGLPFPFALPIDAGLRESEPADARGPSAATVAPLSVEFDSQATNSLGTPGAIAGETEAVRPAKQAIASTALPVAGAGSFIPWHVFVSIGWFAGAAFVFVRMLVAGDRLRRHVATLSPTREPEIIRALEWARERIGTSPVTVLESDRVRVPALVGWWHPQILIPRRESSAWSERDWRAVFLHELAHHVRRDVLCEWAFAFISVVHWFNPLVRWAFARAREERELACDARALRLSREDERIDYGRTLVRVLANGARSLAAGTLGMWSSQSFSERRIRMISRSGHERANLWVAIPLFLAVSALGLTRADDATEAEREGATRERDDGRRVLEVYNLDDIVSADGFAPDFPRPTVDGDRAPSGVNRRSEPQPDGAERSRGDRSAARISDAKSKEIEELVRDALEKAGDGPETRVAVRDRQGSTDLFVTATRRGHEAVVGLLREIRGTDAPLVRIEIRVEALEPEAWSGLSPGLSRKLRVARLRGWKGSSVRLDPREEEEIASALGTETKYSTGVTAWDRQASHCVVVNQRAIIADLELERNDGRTRFEPVVGVSNTGLMAEFRPALSEDRKQLALNVNVEWAEENGPPKTVRASELERFRGIEGADKQLIEVPDLDRAVLETTVIASSGEWIVAGGFTGLPGKAEKRETKGERATALVLVRATLVEAEDAEAAAKKDG